MTTLYKQSVPVLIKYLHNLSGLLTKGEKFATEKGISHEEMLSFRLVPDMRGLPFQVQSCSDTAKSILARVAKLEPVVMADDETTFSQLQERIARTIKLLEEVDPKLIEGGEDEELIWASKMGTYKFTKHSYVTEYVIPNFHFHLTSAYCILRTQGVPVGAFDYLGGVFHKI